jgi:hypothetical protein
VSAGPHATPLADCIAAMHWLFDRGDSRKENVRKLADDVAALEVARDHAAGLLNRWLSQHRDGGVTDPCGVSAALVAETRLAVER